MENPLNKEAYSKRKVKSEHLIRGEFFRDQTAIIHSMPFRRLKNKTQVFFAPENDHVCTRIEHVLHVATISATICKGLNRYGCKLNTEMAYAIGLGHDIGHAPFGHAGETALNKKLNGDFEFMHEVNGLRIVDKLSNGGNGLNLTYGVRDGIINHNGETLQQSIKPSETINILESIRDRKSIASSYEGCITRFADKISYLGRDIEDALIAKFILISDLPNKIREEIGSTNGEIIDKLVIDVIKSSKETDEIKFSDEMFEKIKILQHFNYERIYKNLIILNYREKCENILGELFDYIIDIYTKFGMDYEKYKERDLELDKKFGVYLNTFHNVYIKEKSDPKRIACDYIAGMTDGFALNSYKQIKIPKAIKFK